MKGDFTRLTFKREKHYSSIRCQQGRVDLDADWNEQADITSYRFETETRDVIGSCGFPKSDPGFSIADPTTLSAAKQSALTNEGVLPLKNGDFLIGAGRAYVDGILCENDDIVSFTDQPDLQPSAALSNSKRYCIYLDVWQRYLTALDDPEIREVALGGPDTGTRTKTVWQVRALDVGNASSSITCATVPGWDDATAASTIKLSARASQEQPSDKPCILPPGAGYRRLENQLYRVEIHDPGVVGGGGATPTFKWSRDNGSVVAAINATSATTVTLNAPGKDHALGFAEGQWIELLDDRHDWESQPGVFVPITSVNDLEVTVDPGQAIVPGGTAPNLLTSLDPKYHPKARRWDSIGTTPATIPGTNDGFLPLEDGVEIKFEPGTCKTGDYWVIPARTDKGNVEWPLDNGTPPKPIPQLPRGITHSFCRLAIVNVNGSGKVSLIEDCRTGQVFPPLTGIEDCCTCCTKTVGHTAAADYSRIQDAINSLPADGGQVCVLEGTFSESVVIDSKQNITIIGCGERSKLTAAVSETGDELGPIITIVNSTNIRIESLFFDQALRGAIVVLASAQIRITDCEIVMTNPAGSEPGIFFQANEGLIDHNVITGLGPLFSQDGSIMREGNAVHSLPPHAASGIQLAGGCRRVRVLENFIFFVRGQAITLGNLIQGEGVLSRVPIIGLSRAPEDPCDACSPPSTTVPPRPPGRPPLRSPDSLWEIIIEKNRILSAGLDGIGVIGFFDLSVVDEFVAVRDLRILGNEITDCLRGAIAPIEPSMVDAMGYGGIALAEVSKLVIYDNIIENNGTHQRQPVCGIFVLIGEGIDIQRNRIIGNGFKASSVVIRPSGVIATEVSTGIARRAALTSLLPPPTSASSSAPSSGRQGAIQIVYALAPVTASTPSTQMQPSLEMLSAPSRGEPTGFPALMIHNNIVSAPVGRALSAVALGPVSVVANEFTSNGVSVSEKPSVYTPATIYLLNLGLAQDWYFQNVLFASIETEYPNPSLGVDDLRLGSRLASGNILFADNQCFLDLLESGRAFSLSSSLLLMTLDDLGFQDNQCECDLALREDRVGVHALLYGLSLRATGNRFKEGPLNAVYSAMTKGMMNTTAFNQATHCLYVQGSPGLTHDGPNTVLFSTQCKRRFQETLGALMELKHP
jgi:hypothetical protein